jgi:hypothetical protein
MLIVLLWAIRFRLPPAAIAGVTSKLGVYAAEVIPSEAQRQGRLYIVQLLAECVRQPRESPAGGAPFPITPHVSHDADHTWACRILRFLKRFGF